MGCNEKKERYIYIDIIKIVAILGVILIHVADQYKTQIAVTSNKWGAMNFWIAIGRFSVPAFVMCSGILFLNKVKLSYKEVFCKYIPRLVIAFVIWTLIYALKKANFDFNKAIKILYKGIPRAHLWFLIMITGLYIITPIIRIFIKNAKKKDIEYFLLIAFIIQSLIPFLFEFPKLNWIKNYYKHLYPSVVTGYIGYYVLGYYLNKYDLSKKKKIICIFLGIVSIISTVILNMWKSKMLNKPISNFFNEFYPNIVFYSVFIFIVVKEVCSKINFKDKAKKIIGTIGKNIFGIYLVHMLVKDFFDVFNINALMGNAYISIPIVLLLTFIGSLTITYIISKIPIIKRIIL